MKERWIVLGGKEMKCEKGWKELWDLKRERRKMK